MTIEAERRLELAVVNCIYRQVQEQVSPMTIDLDSELTPYGAPDSLPYDRYLPALLFSNKLAYFRAQGYLTFITAGSASCQVEVADKESILTCLKTWRASLLDDLSKYPLEILYDTVASTALINGERYVLKGKRKKVFEKLLINEGKRYLEREEVMVLLDMDPKARGRDKAADTKHIATFISQLRKQLGLDSNQLRADNSNYLLNCKVSYHNYSLGEAKKTKK